MLFKRYKSEGLAHYSYLIADEGQAAVIDPRRDIEVYLQDAAQDQAYIGRVFETHRNEDYLIGSCEIEAAAGAEIFHADSQWDYQYGEPVEDGQTWMVGRLKIKAIHTPGHTPGSMSYLLHDPDGNPWVFFSGDALFSGDAGRVDLLGEDRLEEMAALLYDSIFNKILPLGDDVLLCPAHGAGSVCGSKIADRTWTTIGMERKYNPLCLVKSEKEFFELHGKMLDRPPYFLKMEELNLAGAPVLGRLPVLKPLNTKAFEKEMTGSQIVDTRDQLGFGGGHIPGSISMYLPILPSFAGWFLKYGEPILFVCDQRDADEIVRTMIRMGFDQLSGYLGEGILGLAVSGNITEYIPLMPVSDFCSMMKKGGEQFILDVRDDDEFTGEGLKHAAHIHLTHLLDSLDQIPKDQPVFPLCRSGNRAMLAASLLKREGWKDVNLLMGGLSAWRAYVCNYDL